MKVTDTTKLIVELEASEAEIFKSALKKILQKLGQPGSYLIWSQVEKQLLYQIQDRLNKTT